MTCPSDLTLNDPRAIINVIKTFIDRCHLSWLSPIPSIRQETCNAYFRNDPVKYDLNIQCSKETTNKML